MTDNQARARAAEAERAREARRLASFAVKFLQAAREILPGDALRLIEAEARERARNA